MDNGEISVEMHLMANGLGLNNTCQATVEKLGEKNDQVKQITLRINGHPSIVVFQEWL